MAHILLVEDDTSIVTNLTEYLRREGFEVTSVGGQTEAMERLEESKGVMGTKGAMGTKGTVAAKGTFSLVLLDISLADGNGFSVCAAVKEQYGLPVIFLTASGDEYSVVAGLDMGADDYIAKPFRPRELVSRINSVLRRYSGKSTVLECGALRLDTAKATVTKNGQELYLSALEYRLLLLFFQNQGVVLSRNRILEELWDLAGEYVNDNTLTVYIKRLREKIEDDPANPVYIRTMRGLGYRMEGRN